MTEQLHQARHLEATLRERLDEPTPLIQVLVGPRQVGKTTAIRAVLAGRGIYETADMPVPLQPDVIEAWWAAAQNAAVPLLAIDEVQKIRGWSEMVKRRWDLQQALPAARRLKVVLSGSAALSIERQLSESLAGRYELLRAEHWNLAESQASFQMELRDYIALGCYPGARRFVDDLPRWAAYIRDAIVEPVLGRDILQVHPVQNPALLRQLFGVAVGMPAQIVSLHKLQGQLQDKGALATLQHYLQILAQSFLLSGLQKFSPVPLRSRSSAPKLIVHDNGLLRAFARPPQAPLSPASFGRYFENAVAARFVEAGWEVFYWRQRHLAVDLVVRGPSGENYAIEVKSSQASGDEMRGLQAFCAQHPDFRPCLVSLLEQQLPGITTLPSAAVLSLSRLQPQLLPQAC